MVQSPETVTPWTRREFPVTVGTDALDAGDTVVLSIDRLADGDVGDTVRCTGRKTTVPMNLVSSLSDRAVQHFRERSRIIAGNTTSFTGTARCTINTTGPTRPTLFQVDPGPNNAADVINSSSQTAVMIDAQFAQPTDAGLRHAHD